jgi:DUF1680 family protein
MTIVVETTRSPHALLKPVPSNAVRFTDTFWAPRLQINHEVTIPSQYRLLEETDRLNNFRRAAGTLDAPFEGIYFNDSDVYKWLEAASAALGAHPDDVMLRKSINDAIAVVAAAQDSDGYLNTYFSVDRIGERWTNLKDMHELYCAGHLFQAAVAHHRATGETTLLQVATRFADHICEVFGPEGRPGAGGHEEIEMGLVELYRDTGERHYLEQAQRFIDLRGQEPSVVGGTEIADRRYRQDHVPFRELAEVTGHAVRMVYLSAGAADVCLEKGDKTLQTAMERQWSNMTGRRSYVTGGLGARWEGEAFGDDFELPSRAYAETCAAIGSVMWNWRMLALTGEARFADVLEKTLYNGLLSGLSLDGREYFYQNLMADDGTHRRQPWFGCACCPPNVARLLAQLPGYVYSVSENSAWVHLYATNEAALTLPHGKTLRLTQNTHYPWDGDIQITVQDAPNDPISLHLRIPDWATGSAITINGKPADAKALPGSYAVVTQAWQPGDVIHLQFPMSARMLTSHPRVADTIGRVALQRGPLVYCVEQADNNEVDVRDVRIPLDAKLETNAEPDLLGGVTTISFVGFESDAEAWRQHLTMKSGTEPEEWPAPVTAIPYYAWANREVGPMRVWLPLWQPKDD